MTGQMGRRISRINVVANRDLLNRSPLEILSENGIEAMAHIIGRSALLSERRGVMSALLGPSTRIASNSVDVITFLVESSLEEAALQLVASKFNLNIPGTGTVYSETVNLQRDCGGFKVCNSLPQQKPKVRMQNQLTGICCIVLRGEGDSVARVALETGSCVPTVTYGLGAGLRDRLGLWRITIPAEKEIVTMVVNSYEAEDIMNIIVDTASLDQPGRGIIYHFPVHSGLINMKVSKESRSQAASLEQMVLALDELKGGTEWRRRRLSSSYRETRRKHLTDLTELALYCDEGNGDEYVKVALAAGASGATLNEYKYVHHEDVKITPAREKCSMITTPRQLRDILTALDKAGVFNPDNHNDVITRSITRAYSYSALQD
ncbi:hypothetical protein QA601_05635 [Chitinispirillales bacterium ANBcel5]|uniref:hypothetical protein n=1 Tax=Cellulosispirillum alkaliphilum TaxID=3039283 RepID=UPI002A55AC3D|nr:hypothetical protein [Chitinispirillales bacterium ANBcel5]